MKKSELRKLIREVISEQIPDYSGGCTYDIALNYNPYASVDDGSCIFPDSCYPNTTLPFKDNNYKKYSRKR